NDFLTHSLPSASFRRFRARSRASPRPVRPALIRFARSKEEAPMNGIARGRSFVPGFVVLFLLLAATTVSAQSAINGVVRDASGAVMPGVTVEASSDVLIEKTRTVPTDSEGRYSIVDLRPGTYTVVFTLTGFSTIRREGVELPSNFTSTINADLKVGAL